MPYKPTEEQQAYIDASGKGENIVLKARAGCGKTATACLLGENHPDKNIWIAVFNKGNAKEMNEKLPKNMNGSTFHSMCGKWFRGKRPELKDGNNCYGHSKKVPLLILKHCDEYNYNEMKRDDPANKIAYDNVTNLSSLVGKMKNTFLSTPSIQEVLELAEFHQVEFIDDPDNFYANAIKILELSDSDRSSMDFDDMIRFHVIDKKVFPDCDIFVGDEVQDSNPIRIELMRLFAEKGVECHAPGDDWQGIYVFTGASIDSVDDVVIELEAKVMPLTINFRCSKAVILEAQKIVPDIKYWDGAIDGSVSEIWPDQINQLFKPGDCAISRYNRTIIPKVFALLREGKKATIQGANFGKQIISIIKKVKYQDIDDFNHNIAKMRDRDLAKCKTELGRQIIDDKYATIEYFIDNSKTVDGAIELVTSLFSDKTVGEYKFSTAHKAKGFEWNNVFILDHDNFKSARAQLPWQQLCERRLEYVAKTRAKENMYYVKETKTVE